MSESLKEALESTDRFLIGTEIVSTRGILAGQESGQILAFTRDVAATPEIDFMNMTDNPGGNPMLLPETLGLDLLYRGKNIVIHFTCKDVNRNGLESRAWNFANMGFENLLVMSGDYPVIGYQGLARPVFDLDSVSLLALLNDMNAGMWVKPRTKWQRLSPTRFYLGCAVSPFKQREDEYLPQLFKLEKKIENGARYIFTQLGYDSRKFDELIRYVELRGWEVPLICNVYVLSRAVARVFKEGRIPGCVVSEHLWEECDRAGKSPDKGKAFFHELAAKQVAIARALGYRGAYIGGVFNLRDLMHVLEIERTFASDDWRQFARDVQYCQPDEAYLFARDPDTGLSDPGRPSEAVRGSTQPAARRSLRWRTSPLYKLNRIMHRHVFERGSIGFRVGKRFYGWVDNGHPHILRALHYWERAIKLHLFDCRDCGDCSLPDIAYLCPVSQCVKNQRNGPCGGTRQGMCEVENGKQCIWARVYRRLAAYNEEETMLAHAPVFTDSSLEGTPSWANTFLGRDHYGEKEGPPEEQETERELTPDTRKVESS